MTITLTDDQRSFLGSKAIDREEYCLRESGWDYPLRDLAERALQLVRLYDFANGTGELADSDHDELVRILRTHANEATESADNEEARSLPRLEAGDSGYIYTGKSLEESLEILTGEIAENRSDAKLCHAILAQLGEIPAGQGVA